MTTHSTKQRMRVKRWSRAEATGSSEGCVSRRRPEAIIVGTVPGCAGASAEPEARAGRRSPFPRAPAMTELRHHHDGPAFADQAGGSSAGSQRPAHHVWRMRAADGTVTRYSRRAAAALARARYSGHLIGARQKVQVRPIPLRQLVTSGLGARAHGVGVGGAAGGCGALANRRGV